VISRVGFHPDAKREMREAADFYDLERRPLMALLRPSVDVLPVTEFRSHTSAVLEQVQRTKRPVILTQHGRSAAVLLNVDVYEDLIEEVAVIRDIRTAEAQLDAGMGIPHEVVEKRLRERYLK
jgi:prevent-host-death family protein